MDEHLYAQQIAGSMSGGLSAANQIRKETALDRLGHHAKVADRVCELIQGFLDRCRGGNGGEGCDNAAKVLLTPTGHFAQLERLANSLARAEELARELGSIG